MVEGVSIKSVERIKEILSDCFDAEHLPALLSAHCLKTFSGILGIQFLYDSDGSYLEEVNGWQVERGLRTLSPHTRATRSSALKAVLGWFATHNLRWQECTELAHMNLMHLSFRGADQAAISKRTWNQWIDHWYAFLRYADRNGYVGSVGFEPSEVKERGVSAPNVKALSPVDFRIFVESLQSQRMRTACAVFVGTGMRVAELANLKVSQVPDPDIPRNRGKAYLEATITGKGGKQRTIYWPIEAVKRVRQYLAQERALCVDTLIKRANFNQIDLSKTYIDPRRNVPEECRYIERGDAPLWLAEDGEPLSYHRWGKDFAAASDKVSHLSIHCTPHTLRHTFAIVTLSMLIKCQIKQELIERALGSAERQLYFVDPLREVKERLGHASIDTTMVYLDHIAEHRELISMAVVELQAAYING